MDIEPTFEWYHEISTKRGVTPRCPHASVERCPRYYQSLSLLKGAGFTGIPDDEDARLLREWERTDLWPRTTEDSTSVEGDGQGFSHYCPEVSFNAFGIFASNYYRPADEIDRDSRYQMLRERGAPPHSWKWTWAHLRPMHFTECDLYSPLTHGGPSRVIDQAGKSQGSTAMPDHDSSQGRALRLLKAIYDQTLNETAPVFVEELASELGLSKDQVKAAWRYLKERGLIKTFNIDYTARVNATGIDVIENAQRNPDKPSREFPAVTYNVVTIGTAHNSPIMQGGEHSKQTQQVTYTENERADLERLVSELKSHLPELNLSETENRKAKAQLATMEAQLTDEPNPTIVREAGRTLRNIIEGAVAGLVAAGVQPLVWGGIAALLAKVAS